MGTEENNKLIAVFMGIDFKDCELFAAHSEEKGFFAAGLEDLKYHSDWNWLMPVVSKISETGYAGGIKGDLNYALSIAEIDHVYAAVVEFIEWYNTEMKKIYEQNRENLKTLKA